MEQAQIDCSLIGKSWWLIKVPKNLENALMKSQNSAVGSLSITRPQSGKPVMTFYPSPNVLQAKSDPDSSLRGVSNTSSSSSSSSVCVADSYSIDPVPVDRLTLSVFSETDPTPDAQGCNGANGRSDIKLPSMGAIKLEGRIKTRGEMRPPKSTNYLRLKAMELKQCNIPTKLTKLTDQVNNFKPRAHSINNVTGMKKPETRVREDADIVREKIFKAFELHQYYNIRDLQKKTGQPINYLKEILTEIADYNTTHPHRFTWELKPQYCHYSSNNT